MARSAFTGSLFRPCKTTMVNYRVYRAMIGTNKAAWSVKLLLTIISSYQVDCGSFCVLLKTQHCVCLLVDGFTHTLAPQIRGKRSATNFIPMDQGKMLPSPIEHYYIALEGGIHFL